MDRNRVDLKFFVKYGVPPLIPLFLLLCIATTVANYLPVFNGKTLYDIFSRLPENHITQFADKGVMSITGTISSKPEEFDNNLEKSDNTKSGKFDKRVRFDLSVHTIREEISITEDVPVMQKVTGMVQMSVYNPLIELTEGDVIEFKGKIKALRNFNNPGGFDYVRYMQNRELWGRVSANGDEITLYTHSKNDSHSVDSNKFAIHNLRDNFTTHIFKNIGSKDSGAILCALTTGNKDFISQELQQDFSRTGGSHILAISGLHLSIVATLFFYLFNGFLSCSEWLLIRGLSKKMAATLTIFPILGYAILSGFSDSTQRAMIMVTIFMMAAIIEREGDTFNSLAAAGIVILLFDPLSLFTVSFQLSFGAVFFILMGLSLAEEYPLLAVKSIFLKKIIDFLLISLFATIGTQILVMHYFNILSFSGLLTNLILIPGVGFAALPLGLAALFFYPFSVAASGFLIKCADFILAPCIAFIKTIAELPGSYIETFTPDIVEITCYYLFMSALFIAVKSWKKGEKRYQWENGGKSIFFKFGVFGATVASLIIVLVMFYEGMWLNKRFFNDKLSVTVLDVGQGNAALIEMPKGKTILVDGGGFPYSSKFDTGEHIIAPFLRQKKIMTLDAVVLTHPDSDHMNGLVYIVDHFRVKYFIKNCDKQESYTYSNLMSGVQRGGSKVLIVDEKREPVKIGDGELNFFNPLKGCSDDQSDNINGNAVAFKVVFDQTSIFFPGDIMAKAEMEIVDKYRNEPVDGIKSLKSDILISPHHGSAGSSIDIFIEHVDPDSIIISCGWQNRFGFPKDVVIERYRKRGIEVFRTDLNGAITLSSDGKKWEIKSFLVRAKPVM